MIVLKLYLKIRQTKVLCAATVLTRKDLIASQTRDTALAWGAVCNLCKIKNHFKDSKGCKRLQKERNPKPANQSQSRSSKKPFLLKVDEDGEEHFYEVVDKICALKQQCDHRKGFANLLISKKRISVNFHVGSTCSILPVDVCKGISGDHDLQDLNTTVRPILSLYDEKIKSRH